MHRTNLVTLLEKYHPIFPEEIRAKHTILNFIAHHPDCFERSLRIGHVTASAWLENHDGTKALLMHHAKLDKWLQLGGHCDGNPDVLAVALKETTEESGLSSIIPVTTDIFDLDIHTIPTHKNVPEHIHYDIRFLLCATKDEPLHTNSESKELRWISKDVHKLPTNEPSVIRMFTKWTQSGSVRTLRSKTAVLY